MSPGPGREALRTRHSATSALWQEQLGPASGCGFSAKSPQRQEPETDFIPDLGHGSLGKTKGGPPGIYGQQSTLTHVHLRQGMCCRVVWGVGAGGWGGREGVV